MAASRPIADAIVVAAGASSRMGGIDKLAAPIGGRPLLAWTIEAIAAAPEVATIVVVTAAERRDEVAGAAWLPSRVTTVVAGGERRQDSVALGFAALEAAHPDVTGERVVLVHDGARPLVPPGLVGAVARAAAEHGAALPVVPIAETIKRIDGELVAATIDRTGLATAQTPQGVRRTLLRQALTTAASDPGREWTDEAALLEACRLPVHALAGAPSNRKVTLPADLGLAAEALVGRPVRIGLGQDVHPFGPGEPLALGGVSIAGAPRLAGHSDGDVALHALADALLGAASLGDLGRLFPAGPATPAGIASTTLLAEVRDRVATAGWRVAGVDLTIVGARPRLAAHLDPMRDAIAAILGLPAGAVGVKASTGNLTGMDGAGRGISASAIATLEAVR